MLSNATIVATRAQKTTTYHAAHIPITKKYPIPFDEMPVPPKINPQKGPTCWYYALNLLRSRYKPVDELVVFAKMAGLEDELNKDPDYLALVNKRAVEKEISAYRKFCSKEKTMELAEKEQRTKEEEKELYDNIPLSISERKKLLNNLIRLNALYKTVSIEFKQECKKLNGNSLFTFAHNSTIHYCSYAYGLISSHWHPRLSDFDTLKKELEIKGPHLFGGAIGETTSPIKTNEIIDGRNVYTWKKGTYEKESFGHAIVIVGAETIATSNGKQQVVFYIDPNNPDIAYKISYTRFKESIYPFPTQVSTATIYCLHADNKLQEKENARYQKIAEKILMHMPHRKSVSHWNDAIDFIHTPKLIEFESVLLKTFDLKDDFKNYQLAREAISAYKAAQAKTKQELEVELKKESPSLQNITEFNRLLREQRINLIEKLAPLNLVSKEDIIAAKQICQNACEIASENCANLLINWIYCLTVSEWKPTDGASALKKEIEEKGSLLVNGNFNPDSYSKKSNLCAAIVTHINFDEKKESSVHLIRAGERFSLSFSQFCQALAPQITRDYYLQFQRSTKPSIYYARYNDFTRSSIINLLSTIRNADTLTALSHANLKENKTLTAQAFREIAGESVRLFRTRNAKSCQTNQAVQPRSLTQIQTAR